MKSLLGLQPIFNVEDEKLKTLTLKLFISIT